MADAPQYTNQQRLTNTHLAIFHGGDSTPGNMSLFEYIGAQWDRPIIRDGKPNRALQELADCKTLLLKQGATIDGLVKAVTALAAGQGADPAVIKAAITEGVQEALAGLKGTVEFELEGK
ncbi:hypothetical protein SEA_SHROOMS_72 [Arthrobacter phage Shrooms]|nr:hypothetical protein SEA_SHROOMS_72 [Arthrobacter phage Shrooms]